MIDRAALALRDFLAKEAAGGIVLIASAALALIVANSFYADAYFGALQTQLTLPLGLVEIDKPLLKWINDGLMAVFFFVVGLEVKREFLDGQLSSRDKASLPLIAALGGMVAPALVFVAINQGTPENLSGWARVRLSCGQGWPCQTPRRHRLAAGPWRLSACRHRLYHEPVHRRPCLHRSGAGRRGQAGRAQRVADRGGRRLCTLTHSASTGNS